MNRPHPFRTNVANAVVELDCPWCAAPILATAHELDDGPVCAACLVRLDLGQPGLDQVRLVEPIAA